MDYYIQGDAARAKEIKAAFEAKGCTLYRLASNCDSEDLIYYSLNGIVRGIKKDNLYLFEAHPGYKELELSVRPKLKVGDWIVGDGCIFKITQYEDEYGYDLTDTTGRVVHFVSPDYVESNFHLWSIEDAKDGDVLVTTGIRNCPFIYRKTGYKNNLAYYYVGIDGDGDLTDGYPKCTLYHFGPVEEVVPATREQRELLFKKMKEAGYTWDEEKKELRKAIEPMFKVGDWITDGTCKVKITEINNTYYWYSKNCILGEIESIDKKYHLWTIEDAKDGDVLAADECYVIFKEIDGLNIKCYCTYHYIGFNPIFFIDTLQNKTAFKPATQEQRALFFKKMKEAGYQWDADKKELKKIQPNYNIANFHAGMPVLVRDDKRKKWCYALYSHYDNEDSYQFVTAGDNPFIQCIPFEGNEHLLGTTDMCDGQYINW